MEDTENKQRKVLTELVNQQVEANEQLKNENEALNVTQRKLLQLLQAKDQKLQQIKQRIKNIDKSSTFTMLSITLKGIEKRLAKSGFHKILDAIKYKEKAFCQLQYFQVKTFSRNFIFMVKVNQLFRRKHIQSTSKAFQLIAAKSSLLETLINQQDIQNGADILDRLIRRMVHVGFARLKPQQNTNKVDLLVHGIDQILKHHKLRDMAHAWKKATIYAKSNFNPFKTFNPGLRQIKSKPKKVIFKLPKAQRSIIKSKIYKQRKCIPGKEKLMKRQLLHNKQRIQQMNTQYKESMCQLMVKSNEMKNSFDQARRDQQAAYENLKMKMIQQDEQSKRQNQELMTQLQQVKSELSNQVSQTVEIEMNLHGEKQEKNVLIQKVHQLQKELSVIKYEIQNASEREKQNYRTTENINQEKLETAQKLEESYMALRSLKNEYDNLKFNYQNAEHYNKDLLNQNQQLQHQIEILNTQVQNLNNKIEEYQVNIELLHVQLNHHMQQSRISLMDSHSQSTQSRASSSNRSGRTNQMEEQIQKLKQQNIELTKEAIQLNEEKLHIKDLIDEQEKQINTLQSQKQQLEMKLKQMIKVLEEQQVICNRDKGIQARLQQVEAENNQLTIKLEQSEANLENAKKTQYLQIQHLAKEKEELLKQVKILQSHQKNNEVHSSQEIQELNNLIADLNREKVNLMRDLTHEHEAKLKLEKEIIYLNDQLETHKAEILSHQEQLELYVKVIKQLDNKMKQKT